MADLNLEAIQQLVTEMRADTIVVPGPISGDIMMTVVIDDMGTLRQLTQFATERLPRESRGRPNI